MRLFGVVGFVIVAAAVVDVFEQRLKGLPILIGF